MIAKFHKAYPGVFYRPGWPTRDGVIPYKLFALYMQALDTVESTEELLHARAVALGIALAINGKESKTKMAVRALIKRAFPEVDVKV